MGAWLLPRNSSGNDRAVAVPLGRIRPPWDTGRSPGPVGHRGAWQLAGTHLAAVGAQLLLWAPSVRRGGVIARLGLVLRRGGMTLPLGHAWQPWGHNPSFGTRLARWGRGCSSGPRQAAAGGWAVSWAPFDRRVGVAALQSPNTTRVGQAGALVSSGRSGSVGETARVTESEGLRVGFRNRRLAESDRRSQGVGSRLIGRM